MATLVEKLESIINVDVDTLDPAVSAALPFQAHDCTSNNLIVNQLMTAPANKDLFWETVKEHKDEGWEVILDFITAKLAAKALKNIKGRVLAQTSPRYAYSTEDVLRHARSYARAFKSVGVPQDRYCIKIAATGPALCAGPQLKKEGISTLGTSLFSVPQAIACSQAECLYISPYYNEVKAHEIADLWPKSEDPALQHPNSPRCYQIAAAYQELHKRTGKPQPLIKLASFISMQETFACAELGAHSETISEQVLEQLSKTKTDSASGVLAKEYTTTRPDPLAYPPSTRLSGHSKVDPLNQNFKGIPSLDIDYLKYNGGALDKSIEEDAETKKRLVEALALFSGAEERSRIEIEKALKDLDLQKLN